MALGSGVVGLKVWSRRVGVSGLGIRVRGEAWEMKFEGHRLTCRFLRLETSATPKTCRNNVIAETFTVGAGGRFVTRGWLPS